MDLRSPADWVLHRADTDPDAPALVFSDGVVTYEQLAGEISRRARSLRTEDLGPATGPGSALTVPVGLDLPSIVEILAMQAADLVPIPDLEPSRPPHTRLPGAAVGLWTSGSSGERRLVPLTMGNLAASVEASRKRLGTDGGDRWLLCLPLHHIGGLSVLFRSFEAGGAAVVAPFGRDLRAVIAATRPTIASLVPTMVTRLLASAPGELASVGVVLTGGGPLRSSTIEGAEKAGVTLVPTYGSTETSSQVATAVPGEPIPHAGFVGTPLEGFDVEIIDPGVTGIGRLAVDGPAVFHGYVGDEQRDRPFVTSDLASLDRSGNLTIHGRSDDVVTVGGENVSLEVVSSTINELEIVSDVAVVAIDDPEWGSRICALVVSDASVDELREASSGLLDRHQVPRSWSTTAAIPLLPNGKHDLRAIRAGFGDR